MVFVASLNGKEVEVANQDVMERINSLKTRRSELEAKAMKNQARRDRAKEAIVELDKQCKEEFGISLKDAPQAIEDRESEMNEILDQYEQALDEAEERMKEIEG